MLLSIFFLTYNSIAASIVLAYWWLSLCSLQHSSISPFKSLMYCSMSFCHRLSKLWCLLLVAYPRLPHPCSLPPLSPCLPPLSCCCLSFTGVNTSCGDKLLHNYSGISCSFLVLFMISVTPPFLSISMHICCVGVLIPIRTTTCHLLHANHMTVLVQVTDLRNQYFSCTLPVSAFPRLSDSTNALLDLHQFSASCLA